MKSRPLTLVLSVALLCGCSDEPSAPARGGSPLGEAISPSVGASVAEQANLLSILNGAVVVERSAELSLNGSAIAAVDSTDLTRWTSTPGNLEQWMIVRLAVPSRIETLGMSTMLGLSAAASYSEIGFAAGNGDEIGIVSLGEPANDARVAVDPVETRDVRLDTRKTFREARIASLPTAFAGGVETESWTRPAIDGAWRFNQHEVVLTGIGDRIRGVVTSMSPPMEIAGTWRGRTIRFLWRRGPQQGEGLMSVTREGDRANAIWFYEKPVLLFAGDAWFGERTGAGEAPAVADFRRYVLDRRGSLPLIDFIWHDDGTIDRERSGTAADELARLLQEVGLESVRLVSYDYLEENAERSSSASQKRLDAIVQMLGERGVDTRSLKREAAGAAAMPDTGTLLERTLRSGVFLEAAR